MLSCFRLMTQDYWENLYQLVTQGKKKELYELLLYFNLGTISSWSLSFSIFCGYYIFWFILFG
jgi:hypothetical protein